MISVLSTRSLFATLWLMTMTLLSGLLLSGCMSSTRSIPSNYSLSFSAKSTTNESSPLKLRVFLLKSDAGFMAADFYSLQNNAQNLLGADVLSTDQFFLTPGQQNNVISGKSSLEARYIGIVAEYQNLNGTKWRLSLPLPQPTETNFYKFWQLSPDELKAQIIADVPGLYVVNQ